MSHRITPLSPMSIQVIRWTFKNTSACSYKFHCNDCGSGSISYMSRAAATRGYQAHLKNVHRSR